MNAKSHSVRATLFIGAALAVTVAGTGCSSAPEAEPTDKSQSEPVTVNKVAAPASGDTATSVADPAEPIYNPSPIRYPLPNPNPPPIVCIIHPGTVGEYAIKPFTNCVGDDCCPVGSNPIRSTD